MTDGRCSRQSWHRWAIIAAGALLLVLGAALWVGFTPPQYFTYTTPTLHDAHTALRVTLPGDWQVARNPPSDPDPTSCYLEHRAATGLRAWIEEHIFRYSPNDWKGCSIAIVCGRSEITDLDAFALNVEKHPEQIYGRGVVQTRRASCAIGPLFQVSHKLARASDGPERRDCMILPPAKPSVTVYSYGSGKGKRTTFQAADDLVSRLRFVSVASGKQDKTVR